MTQSLKSAKSAADPLCAMTALDKLAKAIRSWESSAPLEVRRSWVRTMTPMFVIATVISLFVHAWGGAVIAGVAATFGAVRWRQLRRAPPE